MRQAKSAGNRNLELAHWLLHILQKDRTDLALTADHFKLDRAKLLADATAAVNGFRKNETEMPGISNPVADFSTAGGTMRRFCSARPRFAPVISSSGS